MKKVLLILGFHCLIGFVFIGCCDYPEYEIFDSAGFGVDGDVVESTTSEVDTIRGAFTLTNYYSTRTIANAIPASFGINTAFALSCEDQVAENPLQAEEMELYFDQEIKLNGDIIPANTNLMADTQFRSYARIFYYTETYSYVAIGFIDPFIADVAIPNGNLNIRLISRTSDDLEFDDEITVFVDL